MEGQGHGIIMGVTCPLLEPFYTIQTQTHQTFLGGVYQGKSLLGAANKIFAFKSLLTTLNNVLPLGEGDGIELNIGYLSKSFLIQFGLLSILCLDVYISFLLVSILLLDYIFFLFLFTRSRYNF